METSGVDTIEIAAETLRALKLLTQAQRAIQRAETEAQMLQGVCEVACGVGGFKLAWFGQLEEDRTVTPTAVAGEARDYVDEIEVSWGAEPTGKGPVGRAARKRRAVTSADIVEDPNFTPWRQSAQDFGLSSALALPVSAHDEIHGVLAIYSKTRRDFGQDEIDLLTEMADALGVGLLALRERTRREHAEKRLRAKTIELQEALRTAEEALDHVKHLQGILPICMHCHKIRDDQAAWQRIEDYISSHSGATFTHSLCPDCFSEHYPQLADEAPSQEC